jgi:hypothetical protein
MDSKLAGRNIHRQVDLLTQLWYNFAPTLAGYLDW